MVNKANVLRLANAIEGHALDLGFNMTFWVTRVGRDSSTHHGDEIVDHSGHNCNTVACIGGWVDALILADAGAPISRSAIEDVPSYDGKDFLDLTPEQFFQLTSPKQKIAGPWEDITQEKAVRVLRHLAETGKVDWSVGGGE